MKLDEDAIRHVFELEQTAVDQTNLAKRISKNLRTRPLESPLHWPTFALTTDRPSSESMTAANLHKMLDDAIKEYDQIWLELSIPASDRSISARLKRPFHQLVLFYVNKIGQKQIIFNDRLLRVLNGLVDLERERESKIQTLTQQVAHLMVLRVL